MKEDFKHDINVNVVDNHEKNIIQKSAIRNLVIFINGGDQDKEFFQEIDTENFQVFEQNRRHTNDFGQNFSGMNIFKI